jgi:3-hydroxyacyl-CoA dehydrogenase
VSQRTVAIVGAGLMGHGIAYLFAHEGFRVRVQDPSAASLDSLPTRVARICELLGTDPETMLVQNPMRQRSGKRASRASSW